MERSLRSAYQYFAHRRFIGPLGPRRFLKLHHLFRIKSGNCCVSHCAFTSREVGASCLFGEALAHMAQPMGLYTTSAWTSLLPRLLLFAAVRQHSRLPGLFTLPGLLA